MKRSPLVIVGTVAGLVGVLNFHTTPAKISLGSLTSPTSTGTSASGAGSSTASSSTTAPTKRPGGSGANASTASSSTTSSRPPSTQSTSTTSGPAVTSTTAAPTTTTTVASNVTQTVTGPSVNYYFGLLSVKVTVVGKKITNVGISSLSDGGNYRSQQIDQASIPLLEQEAMRAQNANIQSISGASYTSAGFQLSLQDALKKVGIK
ncbi:MAG: FMN-binding protein [Acidimicrobiales bacterium]